MENDYEFNLKKIRRSSFRAGYRKLIKKKFILSDGKVRDFDIKDEGKSVCILAFTKDNQIILVKQFRLGPETLLVEMPGGFLDPNEQPEFSARGELLEETGFDGDFEFVGTTLDCAYSNMLQYNFIAKSCKKIKAPNEFIETVFYSIEDFLTLLRSGQMTDVNQVIELWTI